MRIIEVEFLWSLAWSKCIMIMNCTRFSLQGKDLSQGTMLTFCFRILVYYYISISLVTVLIVKRIIK